MFKLDKVAKRNTTTFIDYLNLQNKGQTATLYSLRGRVHILEQANWKVRFCAWLGCGLKGDDNKELIEGSVNYLAQQGKKPALQHYCLVVLGFTPETLFSNDPDAQANLKPLSYAELLTNYKQVASNYKSTTDQLVATQNCLQEQSDANKELAKASKEQADAARQISSDKDSQIRTLQNKLKNLQAEHETTTLQLKDANTELKKVKTDLKEKTQALQARSAEYDKLLEAFSEQGNDVVAAQNGQREAAAEIARLQADLKKLGTS